MVNEILPLRPEHALAVAYAPRTARPGLAALLALDDRLATIVRAAREPLIGRMRLTWWFEALERLDGAPPPAEPVLRALAANVLPHGVTGAGLATMIDGWEALLTDEPLDNAALDLFASARGRTLFDAMASVSGASDSQAGQAGRGWALLDLANNLSDREAAERAGRIAAESLRDAFKDRWSREGRALGALALTARLEAEDRIGPGARVARMLWHRLSGR